MDNLKLDAIGLRKCTLFRIVTNLDKDGEFPALTSCIGSVFVSISLSSHIKLW